MTVAASLLVYRHVEVPWRQRLRGESGGAAAASPVADGLPRHA
jgi:hypothetical protein